MRHKRLETDLREIVIYLDSNNKRVEISGYVVENEKEPDFLYVHRDWRIDENRLVESISLLKRQVIARLVIKSVEYVVLKRAC